MKVLLLSENELDKYMAETSKWDVDWSIVFGKSHRIIRKIRDFWHSCEFRAFGEIFSSLSPKVIKKYDLIIINEGLYYLDVLKYIRKYNKHCRLIIFFLNSYAGMGQKYKELFLKTINIQNRQKYKYEVWSFDKKDCQQFALSYNNSYLIKLNVKDIKPKYDICFLGRDKGRLKIVKNFSYILDKLNISYLMKISPDRDVLYHREDRKFFLDDTMPYQQFLQTELQGNCFLELVLEGQNDITYRALEAQFYKRKLITNCKNIKEYDFYTPNNIFILGDDEIDNLKIFVKEPYQVISENCIKKYQFDGWLQNFLA